MNTITTPVAPEYGTEEALAFVEGNGPDGSGRTIHDYFLFDMDKWEECHNHVQWAFPSHIKSRFNPDAPVVDMEEFSNKLSIQGHTNINRLLTNYLHSLGWFEDDAGWHADLTSDRVQHWLSPYNHNYQRISRILNLLSWIDPELAMNLLNEFLNVVVLVENSDAAKFYAHPIISATTVVYWSKAAIGTL